MSAKVDEVARLYKARWTADAIAAKLGVKVETVYVYAHNARRRGEFLPITHPGSKRTLDHAEIKRLAKAGVPQSEIARRVGATLSGVHRIVRVLREIGEPVPPARKQAPQTRWTPERLAEARRIKERAGLKAAAASVGVNPRALRAALDRAA